MIPLALRILLGLGAVLFVLRLSRLANGALPLVVSLPEFLP